MVHPERGFYACWRSIRRLPLAPPSPPLLAAILCDLGGLRCAGAGEFHLELKDINSDAPGWLRVFWSVALAC